MTDGSRQHLSDALVRGQAIGRSLVGLSEADATGLAAEHPDYELQFLPEDAIVTMDLRPNRIRAWTRDGVVVDATAG